MKKEYEIEILKSFIEPIVVKGGLKCEIDSDMSNEDFWKNLEILWSQGKIDGTAHPLRGSQGEWSGLCGGTIYTTELGKERLTFLQTGKIQSQIPQLVYQDYKRITNNIADNKSTIYSHSRVNVKTVKWKVWISIGITIVLSAGIYFLLHL